MSVSFLNKNSREFNERYSGTYGLLEYKNKQSVVQIAAVDSDIARLVDKQGLSYTVNVADEPNDISFHFFLPKTGWVNGKDGPLRVSRVPARQFKFGVCQHNTNIINSKGVAQAVNFDTVETAFLLTPPKAPKLEAGVPWALSSFFCMNKDGRVWGGHVIIGDLEKDRFTFNCVANKQLFSQELADAFRRNGMKVEFA